MIRGLVAKNDQVRMSGTKVPPFCFASMERASGLLNQRRPTLGSRRLSRARTAVAPKEHIH
jgi:hypothetical protein